MYKKMISEGTYIGALSQELGHGEISLLKKYPRDVELAFLLEMLHTPEHANNKKIMGRAIKLSLRQEQYDTAMIYLLKLLHDENEPQTAWVHKNLGKAFWGKRNYGQALKHLLQATELAPHDGQVHDLLGKICQKQGDLERALAHFEKKIDLLGDTGETHRHIGFIYMRKNEYWAAARSFKKAIELGPEQTLSYYGYGIALFRTGAYRAAKKQFKKLAMMNALLDKATYGLALVRMAQYGYRAGQRTLQTIPWYDHRATYIENVPLAGTMTEHAYTQGAKRGIELDMLFSKRNIGFIQNGKARIFPFMGDHWTLYEVIFDIKNNATLTIINYCPDLQTSNTRSWARPSLFKRMRVYVSSMVRQKKDSGLI